MFGAAGLSGCNLTSPETVYTVKHSSPPEINPITSCTHLSSPTRSLPLWLPSTAFSLLSLFSSSSSLSVFLLFRVPKASNHPDQHMCLQDGDFFFFRGGGCKQGETTEMFGTAFFFCFFFFLNPEQCDRRETP